LIAVSDMQIDLGRPNQFRSVIDQGVIRYMTDQYGPNLALEIAMILIPGDLVENGLNYVQWVEDFFAPASHILPYVPLYPVPGNHENNSPYFFDFFNLPLNGTPRFEEHWYYFDQSNVRIIGLDSNGIYRNNIQLDWLVDVLEDACDQDEIDFVFAQLHHPHHSELWPEGNTPFTGVVIEKLEDFSSDCGKPSIHFFGHTHGYARGHSQDHRHVMVNVASAGGNLDYWGEYAQIDYEEYVVSQDEYGFVVVDVDAGDDPAFHLQRISLGNMSEPRDNEVRDQLRIRRFNDPPDQPALQGSLGEQVNPTCFTLALSAYEDEEGDEHTASQWQVAEECDDFSEPVVNRWRQSANWYQGVNLQASDDLTDEVIEDLMPNQDYCWRGRYRDEGLMWSDWSTPQRFRTANQERISYDLNNPNAEEGTEGWVVEQGVFESLEELECNGITPFEGTRYFVVGGLCESSDRAEVSQEIDLTPWVARIRQRELHVSLEAYARNWEGSDLPELGLSFMDAEGVLLMDGGRTSTTQSTWTRMRVSGQAPPGSTKAKITLYGTRMAGEDNDSYFDAIKAEISFGASTCDPPPMQATEEEEPMNDMRMDESMTSNMTVDAGADTPTRIDEGMMNSGGSVTEAEMSDVESMVDDDASGCISHHTLGRPSSDVPGCMVFILILIGWYRSYRELSITSSA